MKRSLCKYNFRTSTVCEEFDCFAPAATKRTKTPFFSKNMENRFKRPLPDFDFMKAQPRPPKNKTMEQIKVVKEQKPIRYKSLEEQRYAKLETAMKDIKSENGNIKSEIEDIKRENNILSEKALEGNKRIGELENELKTITENNAKLKSENNDLKGLNNILEKKTDERIEQIKHLETELQATKKENREIKMEIEGLKCGYESLDVGVTELKKIYMMI